MKNVGIIGTGAIAPAYMQGLAVFPEQIKVVACADINADRAQTFANTYNLDAMSIDDLLASDKVDIIINLTIPAVHALVSLQILNAGKHVYLEKPLAINLADGQEVMRVAQEKNLRVGCAPDTFLGAGGQTARRLIDEGAIGRPVSANAFMMSHGPDSWHPNPFFYFVAGGGPMLDMGPYYLTAMVNLLGSVKQVAGMANRAYDNRTAGHEAIQGDNIPVSVDTHVAGLMQFESGAVGTIITSFDTWQSTLPRIEIHGTEGSISVPDPNRFDGDVLLFTPQTNGWQPVASHHRSDLQRGIGVADMASCIEANKPHRVNGAIALHVLEIMLAFGQSSDNGQFVSIQNTAQRPDALPSNLVTS
ncbi:MAG: Gfo/Idh/MocA family oxidoreductase [Phototrophicaceae bacterium]